MAPEIPNRTLFKTPEVCEIAQVQSYVLRSWEKEFPDLGIARAAGAPRVYRRTDLDRVLRIKHLLFVEGLTLSGVRRRLEEEQPGPTPAGAGDATLDELLGRDTRERLVQIRQGLRAILQILSGAASASSRSVAAGGDFELRPAGAAVKARRPGAAARNGKKKVKRR